MEWIPHLCVNIKNGASSGTLNIGQGFTTCPIVVAGELCVLDKSVFVYHFLEFGTLDEVVIFSVNFMWTGFTGSVYRNKSGQFVDPPARSPRLRLWGRILAQSLRGERKN